MSELITTQALLLASWLKGRIILLPKPGSPANLSNYHPISLLQVVYKVYTKIIANCLSLVVGKHILSHHQMGFWPGMLAQLALQAVADILKDSKVQSTELHLAYIDCKKAFDSDYMKVATLTSSSMVRLASHSPSQEEYAKGTHSLPCYLS
jgi:hypothetical protein